jgi:hypothetical protein
MLEANDEIKKFKFNMLDKVQVDLPGSETALKGTIDLRTPGIEQEDQYRVDCGNGVTVAAPESRITLISKNTDTTGE